MRADPPVPEPDTDKDRQEDLPSMPEQHFHLRIVSESHPGRKRPNNEDHFSVDESRGIIVLADGMGGHRSGEVASEMATRLLMNKLRLLGNTESTEKEQRTELLEGIRLAISETNQSIYQAASDNAEYKGMGTTVVAVLLSGPRIHIGHVGDSRLYCFRQDRLSKLTRDHSLVQDLFDRGLYTEEQARAASVSHILTRSVGLKAQVEIDALTAELQADDLLLVCSDGLTDMVPDWQIREILRDHANRPGTAVTKLIETANYHGGRDNISVILAQACAD